MGSNMSVFKTSPSPWAPCLYCHVVILSSSGWTEPNTRAPDGGAGGGGGVERGMAMDVKGKGNNSLTHKADNTHGGPEAAMALNSTTRLMTYMSGLRLLPWLLATPRGQRCSWSHMCTDYTLTTEGPVWNQKRWSDSQHGGALGVFDFKLSRGNTLNLSVLHWRTTMKDS